MLYWTTLEWHVRVSSWKQFNHGSVWGQCLSTLLLIIMVDVIKWKHIPRYWLFMMGIHQSMVDSPHKDQWCWALIFSLICGWSYCWANNQDNGDLRWYRAHYDVTIMIMIILIFNCYIYCNLFHSNCFTLIIKTVVILCLLAFFHLCAVIFLWEMIASPALATLHCYLPDLWGQWLLGGPVAVSDKMFYVRSQS